MYRLATVFWVSICASSPQGLSGAPQHLHVKEFYGTTENAVKIQLYSAIIAYCLVAIVERKMKLNMEMYDLLRILSVSLLDRTPLVDLLGKSEPAEKLQTVRELSLKFI